MRAVVALEQYPVADTRKERRVPRYTVCSISGCHDLALVRVGKCDKHKPTPWVNPSQHTLQRPKDWKRRQLECLRRDGRRCVWLVAGGVRCGKPARTADHVQPVAEGGSWELANLQSLCDEHDAIKTANDLERMRLKRVRP